MLSKRSGLEGVLKKDTTCQTNNMNSGYKKHYDTVSAESVPFNLLDMYFPDLVPVCQMPLVNLRFIYTINTKTLNSWLLNPKPFN